MIALSLCNGSYRNRIICAIHCIVGWFFQLFQLFHLLLVISVGYFTSLLWIFLFFFFPESLLVGKRGLTLLGPKRCLHANAPLTLGTMRYRLSAIETLWLIILILYQIYLF